MPALCKSREFAFKRRLTHGFEQLESRRLLHAGTHGGDGLPDDVVVGENALPEFALVDANPSSSMRAALVDAAMENQKPWHNSENPLDIDGNGIVIPLDVLIIVDRLNSIGIEKLPPPGVQQSPRLFYDTNGDGDSTPLDALLVVDFLNAESTSTAGEGESPSLTAPLRAEEMDALVSSTNWRLPATQSQGPRWHEYAFASSELTAERFPMDSLDDVAGVAKRDIVFREEAADWLEIPLPSGISDDTTFDGHTLQEGSETVLGMMR